MIPPLPKCEQARLVALRSYGILDTPPEERFDRITRLVSRLLEVPLALVSLVDEDRQWFKSRCGLDATETPREVAFCAHAILGEGALVVEDASRDPRFAANPLVTGELGIRFYAGQPLITSGGFRLGTLCAIDTRPRSLPRAQRELLSDLAQLVMDELELTRALRDAAQQRELLEQRNEELQTFARAVCHDLGAPLRRIRLISEAVQGGEDLAENLGYLAHSTAEAEEVVRGLRAYFTLGAPSLEQVCAQRCYEQACLQLAEEAELLGAQFSATLLPQVRFDSVLLTTVFVNLLGNSLKYADPARPPRVHVSCHERKDCHEVSVRDNGLGIEARFQGEVFSLLRRLHSKSRIPGSGMGLAICKQAVERAGGSIRLESTPGEGSTFSFTLPR